MPSRVRFSMTEMLLGGIKDRPLRSDTLTDAASLFVGRRLLALSAVLILVLWFSLLIWRKSLSQFRVGPLYLIEASTAAIVAVMTLGFVLAGRANIRGLRCNREVVTAVISFCCYCVVRALVEGDLDPQSLLSGVYPLHTVLAIVAASQLNPRAQRFIIITMATLLVTCFIAIPLRSGTYAVLGVDVEAPGETFVYGAAIATALVFIQPIELKVPLVLLLSVTGFLQFQRGVFLNLIVGLLIAAGGWLAIRGLSLRYSFFANFLKGAFLLGILSVVGVAFLRDALKRENARFEVNPKNAILFVQSIWSSDAAVELSVGGTRSHRLEMWQQLIAVGFSDISRALIGKGFRDTPGDELGVSFRVPHNGFITIFYQAGLAGLALFMLVLAAVFRAAMRGASQDLHGRGDYRFRALLLVTLGAFIGDSLAGTIIDSPFTSYLWYTLAGFLLTFLTAVNSAHESV